MENKRRLIKYGIGYGICFIAAILIITVPLIIFAINENAINDDAIDYVYPVGFSLAGIAATFLFFMAFDYKRDGSTITKVIYCALGAVLSLGIWLINLLFSISLIENATLDFGGSLKYSLPAFGLIYTLFAIPYFITASLKRFSERTTDIAVCAFLPLSYLLQFFILMFTKWTLIILGVALLLLIAAAILHGKFGWFGFIFGERKLKRRKGSSSYGNGGNDYNDNEKTQTQQKPEDLNAYKLRDALNSLARRYSSHSLDYSGTAIESMSIYPSGSTVRVKASVTADRERCGVNDCKNYAANQVKDLLDDKIKNEISDWKNTYRTRNTGYDISYEISVRMK